MNRNLRHSLSLFLFLFAMLAGALPATAQNKDTSPHSDAALLAEHTSIQPGTPFTVALRIRMEPHWHSYWKNPGDSGLPTTISWQLPAGWKAGEIQWPHPEKIPTPPLMSFGYENDVWLLTELTPPADLPEKAVTLRAKAKWLICKEACLPAEQNVLLVLPVKNSPAQPDTRWANGFTRTRMAQPTAESGWTVVAEKAANPASFHLRLRPPAGGDAAWAEKDLYFFANDSSTLDHVAPQKVAREGNDFLLTLTPSEYADKEPKRLTGILLAPKDGAWNDSGHRALAVDVPLQKAGGGMAALDAASENAGTTTTTTTAASDSGAPTLPIALALALGGGLLLNLMPCVFPVLSLKILGFVQQSGEDKARIKKHGFMFGAGVLISFWALAGVLLIVRAAGAGAGWGYQLQYPPFLAGLVLLLFLVGLNLLGAFEVGVSLTRVSAPTQNAHGYSGSFWSGVLATVVATPCTAPFMGAALAFALAQPPAVALLVFTFLGIGMALPYVVLSLNPAWIKKLPRPGAWMETFKQLMSFPIFATALWLLWVFGLQTGVDGIAYLLGALLLVGAAIWLWNRWDASTLRPAARVLAQGSALLTLVLALGIAWSGAQFSPPEASAATVQTGDSQEQKVAWQPYSATNVEAALAQGKPVFIDFTAAWCITCQVNKRVTLAQPEVTQAFARRDVVLMRADWTRRDNDITRALESYGRSGVPTYVLLAPGEVKPQVLPEVLSPAIMQEALQNLPSRLAADIPASQQPQ